MIANCLNAGFRVALPSLRQWCLSNFLFPYLISILPAFGLRTLDAMHLAIAQHYGFEHSATADKLFAKAAEALGFTVEVFFNDKTA